MTRSLLVIVSLFAGACGTDVAQTATRPSPGKPFDCSPAKAPVTLPSDPALGGADAITDSPLVGGAYGAGQGPGIAVVARDGFRLYQNDELVAESTASLVPVFVPLTFLPGENVVSVVVSSPERAPAVLVHVDELERPYVSDSDWKVSTNPGEGFTSPGFDASSWSAPLDHGSAEGTAGCEPSSGFVPGSDAHWIGAPDTSARTAVFRLGFRIGPVGYGAATTGGAGATPLVTSDRDELAAALIGQEPALGLIPEGDYDFSKTGAEVTMIDVCPTPCNDGSGLTIYTALPDGQTCADPMVPLPRRERHFAVTSNKTLVGLGRGAMLRGLWLSAGGAENIIARNVGMYDVNPAIVEGGDGFGVDASSRVWLDHMTFRWIGDGFIDVTTGTDITLSWIHFNGRTETACGGHHPRANELGEGDVTIHHSYYDHVTGRAPLAQRVGSHLHVFNDLVSDNPDYAVGAACGASVLVEGSYFENVLHPTSKRECSDDPSLGFILAAPGSNEYDPSSGSHLSGDANAVEPHDENVSRPMYTYELDGLADVRLTVRTRAGTGSHWALPFSL
jgi:pectate lyase